MDKDVAKNSRGIVHAAEQSSNLMPSPVLVFRRVFPRRFPDTIVAVASFVETHIRKKNKKTSGRYNARRYMPGKAVGGQGAKTCYDGDHFSMSPSAVLCCA